MRLSSSVATKYVSIDTDVSDTINEHSAKNAGGSRITSTDGTMLHTNDDAIVTNITACGRCC
jgi:hypothetical protein